MAKIELPYVAWRDGRPRFVPGARERAMGFKGQDLKHDDGRWFTLDEARGFALARQKEIAEQRTSGRKLKSPPVPRGRAVQDLWVAYAGNGSDKTGSDKFRALAPASQASYRKWIKPLQAEPVWLAPVASLDPVILKALHETVKGARGLGMANGMMAALSAALGWGRLHGWLPKVNGHTPPNPASRLDLESPPPRIRIGSDVEIRALVEASDRVEAAGVPLSAIGDAILTGLFSGQRNADVLAFIPGELTNSRIELVQSKTKARVSIPMAPRLVERLAAGRARRAKADYRVVTSNIVINERTGLPYLYQTFATHYQQVREEAAKGCASVADFTFADLRDTAVTWYARAGATIPEIASITGHSLASIYTILKHYLALDAELADNAVRKLVDYMEREGLAV
jgi:integrase